MENTNITTLPPVKDSVFKEEFKKATDFSFSETVANVFDDMVNRSVPFYEEIQRMLGELAADYAQPGTNVYDLGCSTGTTLIQMNKRIPDDVCFIGVDDSAKMLEKCDLKLKALGFNRPYDLHLADINQEVLVRNASVVVLCLTLQFVRPIQRKKLLRGIFEGLLPGGALLLVEKNITEDSLFNRDFIKHYYDYKRRQQYSEMEIAQKREALENVLIPYKLTENTQILKEVGFSHFETFFKWYNFSGLIAVKN